MKQPNKTKTIRAWVNLGSHNKPFVLAIAPNTHPQCEGRYEIYNRKNNGNGTGIPCTITYTLPKGKKNGR